MAYTGVVTYTRSIEISFDVTIEPRMRTYKRTSRPELADQVCRSVLEPDGPRHLEGLSEDHRKQVEHKDPV